METYLTLMHSLAFLTCGSVHHCVLSPWQSTTMEHCIVVKQWHLYEPHWMNKSIWIEMATTTTKWQSEKLAQSNVRHLGEAKFLMGYSGGLGVFRRFLFSLSHLFEVSVTFFLTSCFFEMEDSSHTVWTIRLHLPLSLLCQTSLLNSFFVCWANCTVQTTASKFCVYALFAVGVSFIKWPKDELLIS